MRSTDLNARKRLLRECWEVDDFETMLTVLLNLDFEFCWNLSLSSLGYQFKIRRWREFTIELDWATRLLRIAKILFSLISEPNWRMMTSNKNLNLIKTAQAFITKYLFKEVGHPITCSGYVIWALHTHLCTVVNKTKWTQWTRKQDTTEDHRLGKISGKGQNKWFTIENNY